MIIRRYNAICAATFLAAIALQGTSAHALSMKECSAKYKAAKDAGTLSGMKWNDFRKAQCGAEATATPGPATAQPTPTTAAKPTSPPMSAPAATGNAVFPAAVVVWLGLTAPS